MGSLRAKSISVFKQASVLGLLACLMPVVAWAHSSQVGPASSTCLAGVVCISNGGGQAESVGTGSSTQLIMDGTNGSIASPLITIGTTNVSGTLTLTTGTLISGNLTSGATFNPGTLTITTTGGYGFTGALFTGTFGNASTPIQWISLGKSGIYYQYELIGPVSGTWGPTGSTVSGETAQLFFHSKSPYKGGAIQLSSGTTSIVVPEPASIGLMGTGLIAMGLLVRYKVRR